MSVNDGEAFANSEMTPLVDDGNRASLANSRRRATHSSRVNSLILVEETRGVSELLETRHKLQENDKLSSVGGVRGEGGGHFGSVGGSSAKSSSEIAGGREVLRLERSVLAVKSSCARSSGGISEPRSRVGLSDGGAVEVVTRVENELSELVVEELQFADLILLIRHEFVELDLEVSAERGGEEERAASVLADLHVDVVDTLSVGGSKLVAVHARLLSRREDGHDQSLALGKTSGPQGLNQRLEVILALSGKAKHLEGRVDEGLSRGKLGLKSGGASDDLVLEGLNVLEAHRGVALLIDHGALAGRDRAHNGRGLRLSGLDCGNGSSEGGKLGEHFDFYY